MFGVILTHQIPARWNTATKMPKTPPKTDLMTKEYINSESGASWWETYYGAFEYQLEDHLSSENVLTVLHNGYRENFWVDSMEEPNA